MREVAFTHNFYVVEKMVGNKKAFAVHTVSLAAVSGLNIRRVNEPNFIQELANNGTASCRLQDGPFRGSKMTVQVPNGNGKAKFAANLAVVREESVSGQKVVVEKHSFNQVGFTTDEQGSEMQVTAKVSAAGAVKARTTLNGTEVSFHVKYGPRVTLVGGRGKDGGDVTRVKAAGRVGIPKVELTVGRLQFVADLEPPAVDFSNSTARQGLSLFGYGGHRKAASTTVAETPRKTRTTTTTTHKIVVAGLSLAKATTAVKFTEKERPRMVKILPVKIGSEDAMN